MPSLSEAPSGGAEAFCLLLRFSKVSRCKSGTASRRYRNNGYVLNQQNPGHLSGHLREQARSHKKIPNPRQHKGEPKLPFNFVVACSFFIIEGRPVVVFGSRCPLPLFLAIPIRDQEQTYFFER
ncbi:hypothetical protein [Pseudomonas ogarae]|uniref:hypothetical protein n=1 Tax=Pseudomonas ogarae (strain DSM 112162 / CECT 30235 / F113) TaxID=1114970 RepID=UPI00130539E3|nr:hypothetical protein [Pseudomonas ogarae]